MESKPENGFYITFFILYWLGILLFTILRLKFYLNSILFYGLFIGYCIFYIPLVLMLRKFLYNQTEATY